MDSPRPASREVDVEVVLLREAAGSIAYRVLRAPLQDDDHPDLAALLLAGCAAPSVSHSTSWRMDDDVVVLTYAVVPDPDPSAPAQTLGEPTIVWSGDATRPSPKELHAHHVVAHAVRHLANLRATDPGVRRAAASSEHALLWDLVAAHTDLAVAVHELLPPGHS